MERIRICFVCLGNICRSPTAEACFLDLIEREGLAERFAIDSAGTGDYHVGERAHPDTRAAAKARGVEVRSIARQFVASDFARFDHVIAMDRQNRANLLRMAPDEAAKAKVRLFREFEPGAPGDAEVPDPYYEGGFDRVFEICAAASRGLLEHLRGAHDLG
jgi:protein-tyrosine phosphatase